MRSIVCCVLCCLVSYAAADDTPPAIDTATLADFVLDAAPGGEAQSVAQVRAQAPEPGQRVILRAQVGGRNPPWAPAHALMMLVDAQELQACSTGGCGAPWDFCSAPYEKILSHSALVRWLDAEGQPRAQAFPELAAIAPLSTVVVTGRVADVGDANALVIDLDGLYLEDRGPFAHLMDQ